MNDLDKIQDRSGESGSVTPLEYYERARVHKHTQADLEKILKAADALMPGDTDGYIHINLALVWAYEDVGDYGLAWSYLTEANAAIRQNLIPTITSKQARQLVAKMKAGYPPQRFQRHLQAGHPSRRPIFIIGHPRSGTTLVEAILASHPDVSERGEIPHFRECMGKAVRPSSQFRAVAKCYLEKTIIPNDKTHHRFTDKQPRHSYFVGPIRLAFPNASIVHVVRHPLDIILSCYQTWFSDGMVWTYDLDELTEHYRAHALAMQNWKECGIRFYDILYEDMVNYPKREIDRLLDWCGLPYHHGPHNFFSSGYETDTASKNQVKMPIYRTSVGRWEKYRQHLEPVAESLGLKV